MNPLAPFNAIWASLPMPALLIDAVNTIVAANPAAETFLNASSKSLLHHVLTDKLKADVPLDESLARARANQSGVNINDVTLTTQDGTLPHCLLQMAPLQDDLAQILLLISPRVMAERIGRTRSASTAAKSAIGMAEMLAHEIKNPLAGISGAAQLLSMNLSTEDREMTDLIVEETRRIVKLLQQVEQFGNLRPPEVRAVNIHDALDRARRSALMGYASHMLIVEDYDPSLPATWADPDQLMQVFLNLIKNAAEASRGRQGRIRLRTFYDLALRLRRKDGSGASLPLQIEIIDDGPGIPPDIAGDIFEPFVSGSENGTGLGLALVSKIVADHGGLIGADSIPGRTVFRISLPVAPKDRAKEI